MSSSLQRLADAAGIETSWHDASGKIQTIADDSLRAVLAALGLPAATQSQIGESHSALNAESRAAARPLVTATLNRPVAHAGAPGNFRITLESGNVIEGMAPRGKNGVRLPPLREPGYHKLELNDTVTTIAAAPSRAYTLEDAAGDTKLWGLAIQLYALRRKNSGGIGDFAALAEFVRHAAARGADAVAISPIHAQFSADVTRFGPYSASNRAALNVLFAPLDLPDPDDGDLIDWPRAATQRLQLLRKQFEQLQDDGDIADFRRQAGAQVESHALFEVISANLADTGPAARDFRNWPKALQDPASSEVAQFAATHRREVTFHIWLQYLADRGLAAAQGAARDSGMKIGLITDLAVGTDPTGSHSWTRQEEMLRGLEIGAPPDLFNRAGQNWGITNFSPRGLRNNGFSAFIDMLRHALRHAGGVRIDHVMGLARLWVIPNGFSNADGAYLRMPMEDMMRLVTLESYRHKAVVLGEDLGTLPPGFRRKLNAAGVAGLRVLQFEQQGRTYKAPQKWTRTATAMTTTHDLPTIAGWWQGNDIAWREKLDIAGEDAETRSADRARLWSAFKKSGATAAAMPSCDDTGEVADAASAHLGHAACTLALLPIEDALGLVEQPNLPGTTTQHPNWRRRLPDDSAALFARKDVISRLNALAAARKS